MKTICFLALTAALTVGCKSSPVVVQSAPPTAEDSIRTAIQAHLAHNGNLNLQAFDTNIQQVTIDGDHAKAEVQFRLKAGPGAMQLSYALEKKNGAWAVVDSNAGGSNFDHPAVNPSQNPQPNAGSSSGHSLADTLRGFGLGTPSEQTLPPGHPPINNN